MMLNVMNPCSLALFQVSAETLTMMWQTVVLGMAMVFAVLAILFAVLAIFKLVFAGKSPKEPKVKKAPKTSETEIPEDVLAVVLAAGIRAYEEDQARSDTALVAVITAAVAAYREAEGCAGNFRVVSFKRAGSGRAWNAKK